MLKNLIESKETKLLNINSNYLKSALSVSKIRDAEIQVLKLTQLKYMPSDIQTLSLTPQGWENQLKKKPLKELKQLKKMKKESTGVGPTKCT